MPSSVQSFALFSPSAQGHQCNRQNRLSIMGRTGETHKQCNLDTRPYDSWRRAMLLLFAVSWHNLFSTCFTSYPTVFSSLLPSLCDIPWLFSFSCYTVVLLPVLLSLRLMLPSGIGVWLFIIYPNRYTKTCIIFLNTLQMLQIRDEKNINECFGYLQKMHWIIVVMTQFTPCHTGILSEL